LKLFHLGTCVDGRCDCLPGYHGDVCEYKDSNLQMGETVFGYVDAGQWNYFSVSASSSLILNVSSYMDVSLTPNGDCDL
jgi:hypothetical protein